MRHCDSCQYLSSTGGEYPELYCILVDEDDPKVMDDGKGLGCTYNLRTLKKFARERDEAEYRAYLGYDDFFYADGIDMTEEDSQKLRLIIEVMMHTIGMWPEGLRHAYKRHGKVFYRPYRNYYDTAPGCGGYWMWEQMQKAGHAEVNKTSRGEFWHLTRRGLDWLELKLGMKIYDEED